MSSWPDIEVEDAGPKRKSAWPESNKMARMIRSGRTVSDLAVRYGTNPQVIRQQLLLFGWDPRTGAWIGGIDRGSPLTARGDGAGFALSYVGGGDNPNVVPLAPRPHERKPKPTGFAWPEQPPFVAPQRPQLVTLPPQDQNRPALRKLTNQMVNEIVVRYLDGESSVVLGRDYNVNQRTIRKALSRAGVVIRDRSAANVVRHARRRESMAAQGWIDGVVKPVAS